MSSYRWIILCACLGCAGLVGTLTGCGRRAEQAAASPPTVETTPPSSADRPAPATGSVTGSEPNPGASGISAAELDAELAALQRQFDQLAVEQEQQGAAPARPAGGLGAEPATGAETPAAGRPEDILVVGRITLVSNVPDPTTVPYKDCVTFIKYRVESVASGEYAGEELLAVFWGMRDGKLQPAARFSEGQRHRLTIQPFGERDDLAQVMQADDTNEYSLTPYWVVRYTGA